MITNLLSYECGKWYIFRYVRLITDFHLLQQQNDYILIDRPFYHKSIKESHLYYTLYEITHKQKLCSAAKIAMFGRKCYLYLTEGHAKRDHTSTKTSNQHGYTEQEKLSKLCKRHFLP